MSRTPEGLYVFTRHSSDCKYQSQHGETDRTENRRCNCMKYIAGTAPDGTKIRESANTTSWERARKILLRKFAEHDPTNKPLFELANARAAEQKDELPQRKTLADAIRQFIETKRGEEVVDVAHKFRFRKRCDCGSHIDRTKTCYGGECGRDSHARKRRHTAPHRRSRR